MQWVWAKNGSEEKCEEEVKHTKTCRAAAPVWDVCSRPAAATWSLSQEKHGTSGDSDLFLRNTGTLCTAVLQQTLLQLEDCFIGNVRLPEVSSSKMLNYQFQSCSSVSDPEDRETGVWFMAGRCLNHEMWSEQFLRCCIWRRNDYNYLLTAPALSFLPDSLCVECFVRLIVIWLLYLCSPSQRAIFCPSSRSVLDCCEGNHLLSFSQVSCCFPQWLSGIVLSKCLLMMYNPDAAQRLTDSGLVIDFSRSGCAWTHPACPNPSGYSLVMYHNSRVQTSAHSSSN